MSLCVFTSNKDDLRDALRAYLSEIYTEAIAWREDSPSTLLVEVEDQAMDDIHQIIGEWVAGLE